MTTLETNPDSLNDTGAITIGIPMEEKTFQNSNSNISLRIDQMA